MRILLISAALAVVTYAQFHGLSKFVPTKIETQEELTYHNPRNKTLSDLFDGCYMDAKCLFTPHNTSEPCHDDGHFFKIEMTDEIVEGERKGVVTTYKNATWTATEPENGYTSTIWITETEGDEKPMVKSYFPGNERTGTYDNYRTTAAWLIASGGVVFKEDRTDGWIRLDGNHQALWCPYPRHHP